MLPAAAIAEAGERPQLLAAVVGAAASQGLASRSVDAAPENSGGISGGNSGDLEAGDHETTIAGNQNPDNATGEKALRGVAVDIKGKLFAGGDRAENPQWVALHKLYRRRGFQPIWLTQEGTWRQRVSLWQKTIAFAGTEGLNPRDYDLKQLIENQQHIAGQEDIAALDIAFSQRAIHFVHDLMVGRAKPSAVFPDLFLLPQNRDFATSVEGMLELGSETDMKRAIQEIAPQHPHYDILREALARYTAMHDEVGPLPDIAAGELIRPGDRDPRMPKIRKRMKLLGRIEGQKGAFGRIASFFDTLVGSGQDDDITDNDQNFAYDAETEKAVREFQRASGAYVDGVIGPQTLAALNTPIEDRIEQIRLSMERWRWLPQDLGKKYVFANIAGYYLHGVQNDNIVVSSPIIVGQVAHQTPAFSSVIHDVKFYPDWTVPYSIARRYLLEKVQKDPTVIEKLGYEIYKDRARLAWDQVDVQQLSERDFPGYQFRQKPGPNNALGLVRFSVDNDYSIYLHDTPNQDLFQKGNRAFSSGCIRVQEREKLAVFLMKGNSNLNAGDVGQRFKASEGAELETEIVPLTKEVPVHLVYMTAWVDKNGDVRFGPDIYGRDAKLIEALRQQEGQF
ncbi:L,D-transpeptidase family protein [Kordiimonas sp.]|uniref:L,D-transpeptidase family protein n=1 Tax=Kordiimonas sp. TaxID=1970157 RepID=UPI003A8D1BD6